MDSETIKTRRVIYTEWVSTIAIFLSCFGFLTYKIEKQVDRTDLLYQEFQAQLQTQSTRSDRLYEMFIDLLKEQQKQKT